MHVTDRANCVGACICLFVRERERVCVGVNVMTRPPMEPHPKYPMSQVTRLLLNQTQPQHAPLSSTVCSHDPHNNHRFRPKHM